MNMIIMKLRSVLYASVCSVLLAASAAAPAMAGASETETNPNALAVKAMDTLYRGDARGAVLLFDRAINSRKLDPETLAGALVNRALARQKLGQHEKAIGDYDAALRIDALSARQRAIALYNRGISWRALGKSAQAIEDFTSALFYDPYFAQAYYSRANVLHRSGQYLFALADYDKALKYGYPKPYRAHYAKALIYRLLGRRNDARDALYAALKVRPDYKPARRQLAELLNGKERGVSFADLASGGGRSSAAPETPDRAGRRVVASLTRPGNADLNIRKKPVAAPVAPPAGLAEKVGRPENAKRHETGVRPGNEVAKPVERPLLVASNAGVDLKGRATGSVTPVKSAEGEVTVVPARAPAPEKVIHSGLEKDARPVAEEGKQETKPATVAGETPKVEWTGWTIQISSQRSEDAAWAHWKKLKRKVSRIVHAPKAVVMRAEIEGRGTYYRLRLVGFGENRKLAKRLCARLKRRGTSCLVMRAGS